MLYTDQYPKSINRPNQYSADIDRHPPQPRLDRRSWLRRRVLPAACISLIGLERFADPRAIAAPPWGDLQAREAGGSEDRRVTEALRRGREYLASIQRPDGRFGGQMGGNVAVVSLAGLAWIAGGSLPRRGPYGQAVERAVDYVAGAADDTGFLVKADMMRRGPMYGQGFATLFLAEVIGMSPRDDLDNILRAAVGLILKAQNSQGGWRYTPQPLDADLSVTICQMMALRAARNAGVYVPGEAITKAVDYVRRSQNTDGGFMYQLEGGESRFPLTTGAIVALQNAGRYEGMELELAYQFVNRRLNEYLAPLQHNYFFYAHYYGVQAMWQRGGQDFANYYRRIRKLLLEMQSQDGSWQDVLGRHYGTAMACLVLSAPTSLLPIFQR
ncbi:prenyltransferase/squalene oxidase repeat-containing protein [Planctomycetaceae bacterium SH139]